MRPKVLLIYFICCCLFFLSLYVFHFGEPSYYIPYLGISSTEPTAYYELPQSVPLDSNSTVTKSYWYERTLYMYMESLSGENKNFKPLVNTLDVSSHSGNYSETTDDKPPKFSYARAIRNIVDMENFKIQAEWDSQLTDLHYEKVDLTQHALYKKDYIQKEDFSICAMSLPQDILAIDIINPTLDCLGTPSYAIDGKAIDSQNIPHSLGYLELLQPQIDTLKPVLHYALPIGTCSDIQYLSINKISAYYPLKDNNLQPFSIPNPSLNEVLKTNIHYSALDGLIDFTLTQVRGTDDAVTLTLEYPTPDAPHVSLSLLETSQSRQIYSTTSPTTIEITLKRPLPATDTFTFCIDSVSINKDVDYLIPVKSF